MDVLTIGEALLCLAPPNGPLASAGVLQKSVGGAELNTAVGLARLGNDVSWYSRLSDDAVGDAVLDALTKENVDVSLVRRVSGAPTALMLKDRISEHDVDVLYYRRDSAATGMQAGDVQISDLQRARLLHVTGIGLAIGQGPRELLTWALAEASSLGKIVTYDPNIRPRIIGSARAREMNLEVLPFVNDFLCNESEARIISGCEDLAEAAAFIADHGPQTVIIKLGANGALVHHQGTDINVEAWPAPKPVDPVGAGDAFNAGWIHARLKNLSVEEGLTLAAYVAAQVVQHPDDYEGFPQLSTIPSSLLSDLLITEETAQLR